MNDLVTLTPFPQLQYLYVHSSDTFGVKPQSNELTRGPPELVQQVRRLWGVQIGARALHVLNLIWFSCSARL
jgi:hypothetical protein